MGRKHRRRTDDTGNVNGPAAYGARRVEDFGGEDWVVQTITGSASTKTYRCPGCDHEIRPGEGHKVVVPREAPEDSRPAPPPADIHGIPRPGGPAGPPSAS